MRRVSAVFGAMVLILALAGAPASAVRGRTGPLGSFTHLVVIYEENHSFDNLYGLWGSVGGQPVDGQGSPAYARRSAQVRQDGTPYRCLYQNDPSLATPPLDAACGTDTASNGFTYASHFANQPFPL